jgi:hypothetical protein
VANLGKALTFPLPENDVARVFGVPRNVLLDVSVILPRFFPAVNFLPAVPYSIEGRVSCARRDYKTCGSAASREPGVEPRKQICPVSVPFRTLSPFPRNSQLSQPVPLVAARASCYYKGLNMPRPLAG